MQVALYKSLNYKGGHRDLSSLKGNIPGGTIIKMMNLF